MLLMLLKYNYFDIMGIRKRVGRSCIALATILLFASVSAYLEMIMLSNSSKKVIVTGAESVRISTEILNLSKQHNDIFLEFSINRDKLQLTNSSEDILRSLDSIIFVAQANPDMEKHISVIVEDISKYKRGVRGFYHNIDEDEFWYNHFQANVYFKLVTSMKQYMLSLQQYVVDKTTIIDEGIHRSFMLGIVSIVFMIIILGIFFTLLDIYYLKPVVKLTKSLDSYFTSNKPFVVKVDGKDEVYHLKELILDLISQNKSLEKKNKELFKND